MRQSDRNFLQNFSVSEPCVFGVSVKAPKNDSLLNHSDFLSLFLISRRLLNDSTDSVGKRLIHNLKKVMRLIIVIAQGIFLNQYGTDSLFCPF